MKIFVVILSTILFIGAWSSVNGIVTLQLSGGIPSYRKFISDFRNVLPTVRRVYNIPLLLASAPNTTRFIQINLENFDRNSITVVVDVINVYILGYRQNATHSFFFNELDAKIASQFVFTTTTQVTLPYSSNYNSLQNAANTKRSAIPVGFPALDSAITTLFIYNAPSAARAFLVILQSMAEASRYKYIEDQIVERAQRDEVPSAANLSLQNNWGALSKQIQLAETNNGNFVNNVTITDNKGNAVNITNVNSNIVKKNIQLLKNMNKQ